MQIGWRKRLLDIVETPGGLDMKALSRKAGLDDGYLHGILKRGRSPSIDNFLAVAEAAGVEPGWLLFGDERFRLKFPVVGAVSDRETWRTIDGAKPSKVEFDPGPSPDIVVIEVRGDSNAPVYRDQDLLFCQRHAGSHVHNLVGLDCAVQTRAGEGFLKILHKGSRSGLFNLRSYNPATRDIENVALDWAAPVIWIKRGGL